MGLKRILITGASGYLGSRIASGLANSGFDLILHSNKPFKYKGIKHVNSFNGDILHIDTLKKISDSKPDVIIHLISLDKYDSEIDIDNTLNINVLSTWKLLDLSTKIGVKKFMYFSTTQVYDADLSSPKINPGNNYALTHFLSEEIVKFYNHKYNFKAFSIRLSNSYGEPIFENQKSWNLVVNNLCKIAYDKKVILLKSDGKELKDFIHYSSIIKAIRLLINYDNIFEDAYILSSGESISLVNLAKIIQEVYFNKFGFILDINVNGVNEIYDFNVLKYSQFIPSLIFNDFVNEVNLKKGIELVFDYLISASHK
jgi:UDP-glucose 4-epimerase